MHVLPCAMALLVAASSASGDVEAELWAELAASTDGRAVAIVLLAEPEGAERDLEIDVLQEAVLERLALEGAQFELRYRFEHVAAFTGVLDARALELLASDPFVRGIGGDLQGGIANDSASALTRADRVRSLGIGGDGVVVAVLDTGIDSDHPDLIGGIAPGARHFLGQGSDVGPDVEDLNGHGTNVAGIVTSDGIVAPRGVAPDALVLPIQVIAPSGSGFLSDWAAGMDWVMTQRALQPGLLIANISLGTNQTFDACPCDAERTSVQLLASFLSVARAAGITTFVSSGNLGECGAMPAPACVASAVSVAAVYDQGLGREPDGGTYASNFGGGFGPCFDAVATPDDAACFSSLSACSSLAAPGRRIASTGLGGFTSEYTGTSQAAPHAAGVAALVQSVARVPLAPGAVEALLRGTGFPVGPTAAGCAFAANLRRVDALSAVASASRHPLSCFGDGGTSPGCTSCPCGNDAPANTPGGCRNAEGRSAILFPLGVARIAAGAPRFQLRGASSSSFAVLVSGDARLPLAGACPSGSGQIGGALDGLGCVGQGVKRHGARATDLEGGAGATNPAWGPPDGPTGGVAGRSGFVTGQTRHFQVFYRVDSSSGCGRGQSTTNAASITFVP